MKKLLVVLCMLTCIFGITACGKKEVEEPDFIKVMDDMEVEAAGGIDYIMQDMALYYYDFMVSCVENEVVESYAFQYEEEMGWLTSAATSYESALEDMGSVKNFAFATQEEYYAFLDEIDVDMSKKEVIVNIPLDGEKKDASVEIIFNKKGVVTSMTTNVDYTFGELMTNAALNTLLGMGTVFAVLILISFIISAFKLISVFENAMKKKATQKEIKEEAVNNTIAQIEEREELADDLELVAVIAAAIASYEGTSTDGFVVRSIRKANRNKWLNA